MIFGMFFSELESLNFVIDSLEINTYIHYKISIGFGLYPMKKITNDLKFSIWNNDKRLDNPKKKN